MFVYITCNSVSSATSPPAGVASLKLSETGTHSKISRLEILDDNQCTFLLHRKKERGCLNGFRSVHHGQPEKAFQKGG